jgi:hypothetical protein
VSGFQIQKVITNFQKVIGRGESFWLTLRHIAAQSGPLEVPMNVPHEPTVRRSIAHAQSLRRLRSILSLFAPLILFPTLALAQSPFDSGFTAMQTLFTGTIAKVASLIAIVIGGYQFRILVHTPGVHATQTRCSLIGACFSVSMAQEIRVFYGCITLIENDCTPNVGYVMGNAVCDWSPQRT